MPRILRWVHLPMDERELRNRVKNKMIRPTTIPQTLEALVFEQAVSREALRLSFEQHKAFATSLKGVQQQRTVGDAFQQQESGASLVDRMRMDLLVASGGVLSHAPRLDQTAMMLLDSFEPEGFTELAKDSIFMMPHLGVLASVHPQAAMEVFEKDCLVVLGTAVSAKGEGRRGKACFSYAVTPQSGDVAPASGVVNAGDIVRVPLAAGCTAKVEVRPERGIDLGEGAGRPVVRTVRGGPVGLLLDARGRPLKLSDEVGERRACLRAWNAAVGVHG